MVIIFFAELIAWLYSFHYHKSNHWIYNIITIIQVLLMLYLYFPYFNFKKVRSVFLLLSTMFILLYSTHLFFSDHPRKFDSIAFILAAFLLIFLSISYLGKLIFSDDISPLTKSPFFWICFGNLIYWVGSLFYLGLLNYIVEKELDVFGNLINYFVYTFNAIQYALFIKAILCNLRSDQI